MTTEFNENGFRFKHPENWQIERDEDSDWPRSVSVNSPTGAFWSATEDPTSTNLVEQVVDSIKQEYEEVETHKIAHQIGHLKLEGFELNFYCLDFLVTAQVVHCPEGRRQIVILTQAENRDFDELSNVFDAMTFSLFNNA